MKGLPNQKSSVLFHKLDSYLIIGYRDENYVCGKDRKYFVLDDNFRIHAISKNLLTLFGKEDNDFVKVYTTDYVTVCMDSSFTIIYEKSLLKKESLEENFELWDSTWLAYALSQKGIELNEALQYEMQNDRPKINYLHGLLDFATDYMNFNTIGDAYYDMYFSKEECNVSRLRFETAYFESIKKKCSEKSIINRIETFLFKGSTIKKYNGGSYITSRKIFLIMESIIGNLDYSAYHYNDGYKSSKIILEYDGFYYVLSLDEGD